MAGKPFSIYCRRKKNGKKVYYCRFKNPDGTYSSGKSTEQTSRARAESWAFDYLQNRTSHYQDMKLSEAGKDFFAYDGQWARSKRITGKRLSEKWCDTRQKLFDKYISPEMGGLNLSQITKPVIDDFRNTLYYNKQLAGKTVNHVLISLRLILSFAEERGFLSATPKVETVQGEALKPKKEKGILTVEEVQRVFFHISWPDYTAYVFNLTAALTGIRKGELLAIQLKNIKNGYLEIQKTWDTERLRLTTTTKSGKPRNVVITDRLQKSIYRLVLINPHKTPDSFLFFSPTLADKPIDNQVMVKYFYRALREIGIDEATRKERNLTFHSWRYFANSMMINARLPLMKIQATTGHLTNRMTELYYHVNADEMNDVRDLQDRLFLPEIPEGGQSWT